MPTRIFLHLPDDKACTYYRNTLPFFHCQHELSLNGIEITAEFRPLKYEEFDVYVFNRIVRPDLYLRFMEPLLQVGKKFVWQGDDNLWRIPDWNPVNPMIKDEDFAATNFYISKCEKLWASTPPLGEFIGSPDKVRILPNLVDVNKFNDSIVREDGPIKIVWAGSASHEKDLDDAVEPLIHILEKYGDKLAVIFWGYLPTSLAKFERQPGLPHATVVPKYNNLFLGEWFSLREYFPKLRNLKPDIAIMPLDDCEFNTSKSGLKYLEMSMAGAACVATDLAPYSMIKDKETGFKINAGDSNAWEEILTELVENKELRQKINDTARDQIRNEYSWQCPARKLWVDAFLELGSIL